MRIIIKGSLKAILQSINDRTEKIPESFSLIISSPINESQESIFKHLKFIMKEIAEKQSGKLEIFDNNKDLITIRLSKNFPGDFSNNDFLSLLNSEGIKAEKIKPGGINKQEVE